MSRIKQKLIDKTNKDLKLHKCRNELNSIIQKIKGKKPNLIPQDKLDKIMKMCEKSIFSFKKNIKVRTNFLNYNYVIYKICQIVKYKTENYGIALFSKVKNDSEDKIWKRICNDTGWEYIPTFIKNGVYVYDLSNKDHIKNNGHNDTKNTICKSSNVINDKKLIIAI